MGRPLGKWPTYALASLEQTVEDLKKLERMLSVAQDAIVLGDDAVALRDLSDARVLALECVSTLVRARIGKYQQQEKATRWDKPEEPAMQAVAQVVATRRP